MECHKGFVAAAQMWYIPMSISSELRDQEVEWESSIFGLMVSSIQVQLHWNPSPAASKSWSKTARLHVVYHCITVSLLYVLKHLPRHWGGKKVGPLLGGSSQDS